MNNLLDSLLDLVFPPHCEVCKRDGKATLCSACFEQVRFMKPSMGIHCVAAYDGVMKTAIHRFKFQKRKKLADPLGILTVQYLSQVQINMQEIDTIIPVPLHPNRHRERGFNQVHHVAEVVSRYYGKPVLPALERIRDTKPNYGLKREERYTNVEQAFRVTDSRSVYNKNILLMDDIYTTGATISECARTLKIAGARRIEILSLSRAQEHEA
ncbi:MAG: ComF family protein [Candidatus Margulisiibacteriota bacterium]